MPLRVLTGIGLGLLYHCGADPAARLPFPDKPWEKLGGSEHRADVRGLLRLHRTFGVGKDFPVFYNRVRGTMVVSTLAGSITQFVVNAAQEVSGR